MPIWKDANILIKLLNHSKSKLNSFIEYYISSNYEQTANMLRTKKYFVLLAFLFTLIQLCHMISLQTKMVCENHLLSLTCEHEPNRVIEINSSYYGRFSKKACNPEHKNFRVACFSPNASSIIRDLWEDFHPIADLLIYSLLKTHLIFKL